jgi:hypothetical protein
MPLLSKEQRDQLVKPTASMCATCCTRVIRNYCRSCDEFFHACACEGEDAKHKDHRVYVWTPAGVMAIPDFDNFPS